MKLTLRAQFSLLGIAAIAVLPLSALATGGTAQVLADCGVTSSVGSADANSPYDPSCNSAPDGSGAIGAAPDAGTIIACRNIAGCLSYEVNSPGGVSVPHRNTGVQQSQ